MTTDLLFARRQRVVDDSLQAEAMRESEGRKTGGLIRTSRRSELSLILIRWGKIARAARFEIGLTYRPQSSMLRRSVVRRGRRAVSRPREMVLAI